MSKFYSAETQQGHSPHFVQYIRHLAEASSKQQEDHIVTDDLKELKATLTSSTAKDEELLKEYAVRAYYAEMMGHSAEFAYIHCINLACHGQLNFKRTGYLATQLMVNPDSELMYLIVSSIQRDLKSPNYLEVAAALTAAAQMLRPELITVVQGDVAGLVAHEKPVVRRKAVEAMHAFYLRSDGAVGDSAAFRQALCDRDPSVMDAATRLLHAVVQRSPDAHRDLLDSFVLILSQVIERRLPRTYDYHRAPAPWLQIRVIQLLTILIGQDGQRAQKAARVLEEAMQRADNGKLIGFAIVCELIRTAATIPRLPGLLALAAEAVSGLITARNPNLRCAGIQALSYMVRVNPELAVEHQEVVMCCLEDADETIRRKTIWLLFAICSSDNIDPIARRLIRFLRKVSDPFLKRSTARGLCRLMEQYATDPWWYIRTMNSVLAVAAECVLPATIQRMLKLIAEGQGVDEAADTRFRSRCVEAYFAITGGAAADGAVVPDVLRRVGAWVMGEYGFLVNKISAEMLLGRLCDLMEQTEDGETRCWILTAIMKVSTQLPTASAAGSNGGGAAPGTDYADDMVAQFKESRWIPLQQRCYEFAVLRRQPELLRRVLPTDGFCEAIDVDSELHFLDSFIETAAARGAQRYQQPADIASLQRRRAAGSAPAAAATTLRTDAYVTARPTDIRPAWGAGSPAPATPATQPSDAAAAGVAATPSNAGLAQSVLQGGAETLVLQPTATKRWGAQNLREVEAAEEEVHLQVTAAAAVGGGGVVWGADALQSGEEAPAPADTDAGPLTSASGAFRETNAGDAVGPSRDRAGLAETRPVSSKNAKFVRSIFGGGRRKNVERAAVPPPTAPVPHASSVPHGVAAPQTASVHIDVSSPAPSPAPPRPRAGVMDALFATATSSPLASTSPPAPSGQASGGTEWFHSSSPANVSAEAPAAGRSSALLSSLHPAATTFDTERFGRTWQGMGATAECRRQLRCADLSSCAVPGGAFQRRLLQVCSMRVVQVIGREMIVAAQYTGERGQPEYALAHLSVTGDSTLTAVVRCSRREMSEEVMTALQQL